MSNAVHPYTSSLFISLLVAEVNPANLPIDEMYHPKQTVYEKYLYCLEASDIQLQIISKKFKLITRTYLYLRYHFFYHLLENRNITTFIA